MKSYKITKLEKNRKSILTEDLTHCIICGSTNTQLHEVYFGKNRQNSMIYGCVIPLCLTHHNEIHSNNELDNYYKKIMQIQFEEIYPNISFISVFYKNYK